MKRKIKIIFAASSATAFVISVYVSPGRSAEGPRQWKAPPPAAERKNPLPPGPQSVAAGKALYGRECASCHGAGGKGDGKDGRDLDPSPADLSSPNVSGQTDGTLFWKISTGRRPMPPFRKDLSDEERWQVVHYLRTLAPQPGKGGNPVP